MQVSTYLMVLSTISFSTSLHRKNARASISNILLTVFVLFLFFPGQEYCTSVLPTISFSRSLHRKNARASISPILLTVFVIFFFFKPRVLHYCQSQCVNLDFVMTTKNALLTFVHTQSKICMLLTISFSTSLHRKNARASILPILLTVWLFSGQEYCTSVNLNVLI